MDTPFGKPSDTIVAGRLGEPPMARRQDKPPLPSLRNCLPPKGVTLKCWRRYLEKSDLVAILRTDKAQFQRIHEQDPRAEPDLSGADLSGCDLAGIPLAGAKLANACLRGADCAGANLRFSDLSGADLRDANLERANLHHVVLEGANLEGATLGGIERDTRLCLHVSTFRRVRWSREELETMLRILNENESWEIRYQIVPKGAPQA